LDNPESDVSKLIEALKEIRKEGTKSIIDVGEFRGISVRERYNIDKVDKLAREALALIKE
jgi:hypothetical protein